MNRESLLAQFDQLIPLAGHWAEAFEARIMREGVPLLETEMADAWALGARAGACPPALSDQRADAR